MPVSRRMMDAGTAKIILCEDSSLPETNLDRNWSEVVYDGVQEPFVVREHWHANHTELLEVKSGIVEITVDGKTTSAAPSDGVVSVRPYSLHGFRTVRGTPSVLVERPSPAAYAPAKQIFLEDFTVFSASNQRAHSIVTSVRGFLYFMRICADGDTYLPLPFRFRVLEFLLVKTLGNLARPFVPARPDLQFRTKQA